MSEPEKPIIAEDVAAIAMRELKDTSRAFPPHRRKDIPPPDNIFIHFHTGNQHLPIHDKDIAAAAIKILENALPGVAVTPATAPSGGVIPEWITLPKKDYETFLNKQRPAEPANARGAPPEIFDPIVLPASVVAEANAVAMHRLKEKWRIFPATGYDVPPGNLALGIVFSDEAASCPEHEIVPDQAIIDAAIQILKNAIPGIAVTLLKSRPSMAQWITLPKEAYEAFLEKQEPHEPTRLDAYPIYETSCLTNNLRF